MIARLSYCIRRSIQYESRAVFLSFFFSKQSPDSSPSLYLHTNEPGLISSSLFLSFINEKMNSKKKKVCQVGVSNTRLFDTILSFYHYSNEPLLENGNRTSFVKSSVFKFAYCIYWPFSLFAFSIYWPFSLLTNHKMNNQMNRENRI